MSTLNNILEHIGEFGRFQRRVYLVVNVLTIFQCCQMFLLVFVADKPEWRCSEEESAHLDQKKKAQGYPCYENGSICKNISFNGEVTSIATEWKLICDQEYKINLAQAVIMAGCLAGAIVFGGLADRRGRKFAIVLTQCLASVFSLASGLAQSYIQFVTLRFLTAATLTGSGMTIYVLISEILGPSPRELLLTVHQSFYSFGYVVLAVLAYFIRDWRKLTVVIALPSAICAMSFLGNVCESPQWLLGKGKFEESKELLMEMAKENGNEIPEKFLQELSKNLPSKDPNSSQGLNIFTTDGYLRKITFLSTAWFFFSMLYYALSLSSKSTSSNKYISFCFSGLVEIPSLVTSMFLIKFGRKKSLFYLALTGTFACFGCSWLLGTDKSRVGSFVMLLAMLGKFAIAASYNILYIFSTEQFSATVRSFSMGICATAAGFGGIFAPLLANLELYDKRLPMFIFGVVAICCGTLVQNLPETLKVHELDKKKD